MTDHFPADDSLTDQELFEQVILFYRERLKDHAPALTYLQARGLTHPELLEQFAIGLADRALSRTLPRPQLAAGKRLRGRLQQLGIYRPTGHGHFNGCITIPIRTMDGQVADLYGRKICRHLLKRTERHMWLPADHRPLANRRGVLNASALQATDEVILCQSVIDALTFWSAGLRNVTASHGVNGLSGELLEALRASSIRRVIVAYRHTDAGGHAAEEVAERLVAAGHEAFRLRFPLGLDANDYALREGPQRLAELVRRAQWEGNGPAPAAEVPKLLLLPAPMAVAKEPSAPDDKTPTAATPVAPVASPMPTAGPAPIDAEVTDTDVVITFDDRRYRVRGLEKNHSLDRLKINLLVSRDGLMHVDTLDLYASRARSYFIKQAAAELYTEEETIKRDLARVLLKLETLQEEQIKSRLTVKEPEAVELSDQERHEALEFLQDPNLLDRILEDYDRCGLAGEETNKLVSYLSCVSRLLPEPLAVMVQSGSGAGKTSLMDATLALMPAEEQIQYSAMTSQALYYMDRKSMKHKILAVAEEGGVAEAAYALKLLQSDGVLRIASAGKDADTGRNQTQDYEVEGPVMMFLTTTSESPDPELQNRCLTLRVNEQTGQTEAIHARQRIAYTLAGRQAMGTREAIRRRHQNAQRLLKPYAVIIPWANELTFRRDQLGMRRDHAKYLSLIASITLLHQYQRTIRTDPTSGEKYLEASLEDIERANRLASEVLGQSLDALMTQTRQLLVLLDDYVEQRCQKEEASRLELRFTQRELREALSWSDFTLRKHLARLMELEYILVHRTGRGNQREYELLYQGEGRDGQPFVLGLIDVSKLRQMKYDNQNEHFRERNEPVASPTGAPIEPHSSSSKDGASANGNGQLVQPLRKPSGNGQEPPFDF